MVDLARKGGVEGRVSFVKGVLGRLICAMLGLWGRLLKRVEDYGTGESDAAKCNS